NTFYEVNRFRRDNEGKYRYELVPARLRGDIASFDIKGKSGKVVVEQGRRITARHIRELESAGISQLEVPREYLIGRSLARDVVDTETGEILVPCNTALTAADLTKIEEAGLDTIDTIYTNDIDHGPF